MQPSGETSLGGSLSPRRVSRHAEEANSVNFVSCGEAVLIGRFCILDCVVGQKHCPFYRGCPLVFTNQLLVEVD